MIFFLSVLCESLRLVRRVVLGESLELDSDGQSLAGQMRRYGAVNNTTASGISLTEYTEFGMEPIDDGDQTEQSARSVWAIVGRTPGRAPAWRGPVSVPGPAPDI